MELISNFQNLQLNASEIKGNITLSQKMKPQLYHNDYYFRISSSNNQGKFTWRCVSKNCRGGCYTYSDKFGEDCEVWVTNSEHLDTPDPVKFTNLEHRRKLKEKATLSDEPPRKIITHFEQELDEDEAIALSASYDALRQVINRAKDKIKPDYPIQPNDLKAIEFPEFLKKTIHSDENFMFYDSGIDDPERFFIFTTASNLKYLEGKHLFCDGTFDIAPKPFYQVYSIHALVNCQCLPMVYCLLPKKNQKLYERFLSQIKEALEYMPTSITSDFEQAFINASRKVFPGVNVFGCFFHFKQNLFRKIQDLGLVDTYNNDSKLRNLLKLPQSLAFVPIDDVISTFETVKSQSPPEFIDFFQFIDYFETTYIGKLVRTKGRYPKIIRKSPLYEIGFWNVNQRVSENIPKTNNFVESWHKAFSVSFILFYLFIYIYIFYKLIIKSVLVSHPLVYTLVDAFKREQKLTSNRLLKINTGIIYRRKPEYILLDERIRNMLSIYKSNDSLSFLHNLGLILKY